MCIYCYFKGLLKIIRGNPSFSIKIICWLPYAFYFYTYLYIFKSLLGRNSVINFNFKETSGEGKEWSSQQRQLHSFEISSWQVCLGLSAIVEAQQYPAREFHKSINSYSCKGSGICTNGNMLQCDFYCWITNPLLLHCFWLAIYCFNTGIWDSRVGGFP